MNNVPAKVESSGQPDPSKKPTDKQQVGKITVLLNGKTKTLNVYWYGEDVTSQGTSRSSKNIKAIKDFAKTMYEQMKEQKITSPLQTEVEVEYLKDQSPERDFKILSAKYVHKENTPAKETLPTIEQGKRSEKEEHAKMPPFMVIEGLTRAILTRAILTSRGMITFQRTEEGKENCRAVIERVPKEGEDVSKTSVHMTVKDVTEASPSAKTRPMTKEDINKVIKKYKNTYLQDLLKAMPSIPSEVQRGIDGLTYYIAQNQEVHKQKISRFQELRPVDIESILDMTNQYYPNNPTLEKTNQKLKAAFKFTDKILESPENYKTFIDNLTNLLNELESAVQSIETSKLKKQEQEEIPMLFKKISTAKSNLVASVKRYALFEKNWEKLLRENLVSPIWDILSENDDLTIDSAMEKYLTKEMIERAISFHLHLEDL